MFGEANREMVARWKAAAAAGQQEPVAVLRRRTAAFLQFCVEDPVRHQLLFQRTIPGFEPSPESYAPAVEGLSDLHDRLRACGVDDPRAWDVWTATARGPDGPAERERAWRRPLAAARRRHHRHVPRALGARDATRRERPIMIIEMLDVADIPVLEHDEAMAVAAAEYDRLLELVDRFGPDDWTRRTDCPDWDVRDMVTHLLGFMKANADHAETGRQLAHGRPRGRGAGHPAAGRPDGAARPRARRPVSRRGVRGRARVGRPGARRAGPRPRPSSAPATLSTGLPGEADWTVAYLLDVVFTRDVWMHRVDLCRATGQPMVLTPDHDGRIVADVVADWARRHGQPFTLRLDGPAGGAFTAGQDGPEIRLDAVEFCRILSGRATGDGLLATFVPF